MIRALFLDLDNTIADRDAAVRAWLGRVGREAPGGRFDLETLVTRDGGGHGDRRPFFRALSSALGVSTAAARARFRSQIAEAFVERPDATKLIGRFPGPIVVITNGDVPLQQRKVRALSLHTRVHAVLFARRHGGEKPGPAAFEAALSAAKVAPHEALMIGDHPVADVAGAEGVGIDARLLRTRWFTPNAAHRVIDSLDEVSW